MIKTVVNPINVKINNQIQHLAELATDPTNISAKRHREDLMILLIPKLRFFIWKFFQNDEETEDVLHNALEKICLSMHTYDKQYRFLTWSFGISKNESLTYINETKKMPMNTVEDIFAYLENKSIDNIDDVKAKEMQFGELYRKAIAAIYSLPENDDKYIIIDVHVNKMKQNDIARKYNMNPNTVKTRLKKTRDKIKKIILKESPELASSRTKHGQRNSPINAIMEF